MEAFNEMNKHQEDNSDFSFGCPQIYRQKNKSYDTREQSKCDLKTVNNSTKNSKS